MIFQSFTDGVAVRVRKKDLSRKGLTLMELVVVMTILAALAAIVIPLLPNLLRARTRSPTVHKRVKWPRQCKRIRHCT